MHYDNLLLAIRPLSLSRILVVIYPRYSGAEGSVVGCKAARGNRITGLGEPEGLGKRQGAGADTSDCSRGDCVGVGIKIGVTGAVHRGGAVACGCGTL